jgi:hypothetical protein
MSLPLAALGLAAVLARTVPAGAAGHQHCRRDRRQTAWIETSRVSALRCTRANRNESLDSDLDGTPRLWLAPRPAQNASYPFTRMLPRSRGKVIVAEWLRASIVNGLSLPRRFTRLGSSVAYLSKAGSYLTSR